MSTAVLIVNGCCALAGIAAAQYGFVNAIQTRTTIAVHFAHVALLIWYATVCLTVGFGIFDPDPTALTSLLRYAFGPLLLTVAVRQWLTGRKTVTL